MARKMEPLAGMPLIERVELTSDETPPWTGMAFTLPVDSDRLSEDLKREYPQCSTLRERKHMAAIDFLRAELHFMQSKSSTRTFEEDEFLATPGATSTCSDALDDRSRRDSTSSHLSPVNITQDDGTLMHDLHQTETNISPNVTTAFIPSIPDTAQQFVFSVVDGRSLKPKTKRRMTREEKAAYRTTRKHGACPTCRRQKGKCTHAGNASNPEGVSKSQKKTFSRDSSADRTQANTMPKMVYQKPLQAITNATPTVDQVSFLTPNTTPSFTKSSSQTTGDLDTPHWGEEMDEGAGSDLSRYVQHHVSVDFYRGSMPFEPDPTWQDLSTVSRMEPFNPGYSHFQASGVPEVPKPLSPTTNPSPMEFSYQSTLSPYTPNLWMETQEHGPKPMEPG